MFNYVKRLYQIYRFFWLLFEQQFFRLVSHLDVSRCACLCVQLVLAAAPATERSERVGEEAPGSWMLH